MNPTCTMYCTMHCTWIIFMKIAAHTTNMDDDGNGLDDEDGAVVQRRYSVSPIQWTKAMYKGNTVEVNG